MKQALAPASIRSLFSFFVVFAAFAVTDSIKRFHLIRFKMINNDPAFLTYNSTHKYPLPNPLIVTILFA